MRAARYAGVILLAFVVMYWLDYRATFIHRADFDKAVVADAKNPTAENQTHLEREGHINDLIRRHDAAIFVAIEVGLVSGFWAFVSIYYKRKRRSSGNQATP